MTLSGPDFIIPGASKSGTTSLYHYLNEHEDIFLPETKELHFFERDNKYKEGLSEYESYFPPADDGRIAGEVTPTYFNHGIVYEQSAHTTYKWSPDDDAPKRIAESYPNIKLIITLRNPLTRANSQFWKNYRQGRERADTFEEAIREELAGGRSKEDHPLCWLYRNEYVTHIERWLDLFEREQIHFIIFERWIQNPKQTLNELCEFLGVEPKSSWSRSGDQKNVGGMPRSVAINRFYQDHIRDTALGALLRKYRITHRLDAFNSSEGYPELSDDAKRLLTNRFAPELAELEGLIEADLDIWRKEMEV